MKKLTLDLDALQVESFAIPAEDEMRGTVEGHGPSYKCASKTDPCFTEHESCYWRKC